MAEKYGTVPPRFTKAWWEHFWYYYKWRVIITAVAILVAVVTIVQCATRPKYDMNIIYAGHMHYSDKEIEKTQNLLSDYIEDIDKNGKKSIFFQQLVFSDGAGSEEYDYAIQTKLDFTFTDDYTYVYLMDEVEAKLYLQRKSIEDTFVNTDEYAVDTNAEILRREDGTGYAVNLKDSKLLRDNGIYCDDLYLMVRVLNENDEKNKQSYEDALKIASELVK